VAPKKKEKKNQLPKTGIFKDPQKNPNKTVGTGWEGGYGVCSVQPIPETVRTRDPKNHGLPEKTRVTPYPWDGSHVLSLCGYHFQLDEVIVT